MSFITPTVQRNRPRYVSWSYSSLDSWRSCPRRHLETRIEKKWDEGGESEEQKFGKLVHKAIEDRIMLGKPIPSRLQNTLKADMEGWCRRVLDGAPTAKEWNEANGGRIVGEQQLAITEQFQPCEWFDKRHDVWARAMIDVAKVKGPGAALYDWKTGKTKEGGSDQLLLSAALMFIHNPELQAVRTMYVWLKEDATTTLDITRAQIGEFWAYLLPDINKYRKGVSTLDMPPKPSGLCNWCPVRTCEFHPSK